MIGLIHAYARTNAGDGLLVDLAADRLRKIGVRRDDLLLVALDPESFPEFTHRIGVGTPGRRPSVETAAALAHSVPALVPGLQRTTRLRRVLSRVDGLVAVGGGYLRSGDFVEMVGVATNHLPQLAAAANLDVPAVYLPQSVGPLRGPTGRLIRRNLARLDQVWLRDDTSMSEVQVPWAERMADLAVLDIADGYEVSGVAAGNPVGIIGRRLDRPDAGDSLLRLASALDAVEWLVQSTGRAEKSDADYYAELGVEASGGTVERVSSGGLSAVVSVRLHGALMAIRAGVPAVHLAYQRKGWAAYADLGLDEFVHDAGGFDPVRVAAQARGLARDPGRFWRVVEGALPALRADSRRLTTTLRSVLGR